MMNNMTQCAVFDFDGTLRKGHITQLFKDELYKNNLFDKEEYVFQKEIFDLYCAGNLSYRQWLDRWAISWGRAFRGLQQNNILFIANDVFKKGKNDLFSSSQQLIKFFNDKNFKTLIISAGASEVVDLFSQYLGAHYSIATKLEVVDGIYTGKMLSNIHTSEGKGLALKIFLKKIGIHQPFFAFGDSTGDFAILEQAITPIALNTNKELTAIAIEKGWPIKTSKNIMSYLNSLQT